MDPSIPTPSQQSSSTLAETPKRNQEKHLEGRPAAVKKPRSMEGIVQLPLTRDGTLEYKTKHQMLHQYNDRTHDVVLSKNDPNEVNFYAPRADKAGDNFAGVIGATDEALGALVQTIKAEMGPENERKLITFAFAIISEDEHRESKEDTVLNRSKTGNSRNSSSKALTNPQIASSPLAWGVGGPERRLASAQPTHVAPAPNITIPTKEGVFPDFPDVARSLSTPTLATTPWIKQEPTIAEPGTPVTFQVPSAHVPQTQPEPQQAVIQSMGDKNKRSCSVATTTANTHDRSLNVVLPTFNGPHISDGLLGALLQKQWPPFNRSLHPDFSALGCLVVVYRNVLRSLYNHNEPARSFKEIYELGTGFKGQKRKLWDYLWLDMNFPSDGPVYNAFHKRTTELIHKLRASMNQEDEEDDAPTVAKFTFKEIIGGAISLNKLWDSVPGLRLLRVGVFRDSIGGQWKQSPTNAFGFSSLIEYTSAQLAASAASTGTVDHEISLETVVNKLFHFQVGQGIFAPRGSDHANIRLTCAFPAVIRVRYASQDPIPDSRPPTAHNDEEPDARNPTYDWLRDGPGQDLRGFSILQERWNTKAADLPRRQQAYRLMAVVRMRNSVEECDLVRIYSDVGECILPMMTDLVYSSGGWSLSEPHREFMLYYVPCSYNARFPPVGMNSFPEGYEDAN